MKLSNFRPRPMEFGSAYHLLFSRRIDRTHDTASLRRLLASFPDVRDTNPEQAGYVTHRSPLIDEVVILKRPLSRLPCFVFNALHIPEHLNRDPGRIGVVSCNIVPGSMAARPPSQAAPLAAKRICEPGKFRHAIHLKCHVEQTVRAMTYACCVMVGITAQEYQNLLSASVRVIGDAKAEHCGHELGH